MDSKRNSWVAFGPTITLPYCFVHLGSVYTSLPQHPVYSPLLISLSIASLSISRTVVTKVSTGIPSYSFYVLSRQ